MSGRGFIQGTAQPFTPHPRSFRASCGKRKAQTRTKGLLYAQTVQPWEAHRHVSGWASCSFAVPSGTCRALSHWGVSPPGLFAMGRNWANPPSWGGSGEARPHLHPTSGHTCGSAPALPLLNG